MSKYSDDTKAAVMAALLAGQSISKVSEEFAIPRSTVGNWSAKLNQAGVPTVPDEKKEEIGDRLLILVDKMLDAQFSMLEILAEKEYLRKQDIAELGMAFGVNNDKLDRILARLSNATDNQAASD